LAAYGLENSKLKQENYGYTFTAIAIAVCASSMVMRSEFDKNVLSFSSETEYGKDKDGDGVKDKKDKCPDTPKDVKVDANGCPLDADKDGVADYMDKCPTDIGNAGMNGCPDTDKDGVSDKDDGCPNVPGMTRFKGCPDSDGDGIEDAMDRCPNAKGTDLFKGCPDTDGDGIEDGMDKCPDTKKGIKIDTRGCPSDIDGDGVIDSEDKCPTTKAEGTPNGCPVVKPEVKKRLAFAARGINFETGEAKLKISSFAVLDEVVSIMKEYPDYILKIGGHTDDVGDDNANLLLSQARVDAVKNYLVTKGVPLGRIEAVGYGETRPVETNKTSVGKAQNRRVELELILKN
jgi:OOP family OmpA-OmpF porin